MKRPAPSSGTSETAPPVRSGSRRRLAIVLAIASALVLLAIVPGYLASRPDFFARYPALSSRYAPWTVSAHAGTPCDACHVRPGLLGRTAYRLRMVGEFYVSLVSRSRAPDVFAVPTDEACLVCHSDLRTVSPKGDLKIPHRAHVTILKMRCVECHRYLVHEKSPEGKRVPPMAACLKCHDGDKAKSACSTCHTQKAAPASHKAADWLVDHGGQTADAACQKCHRWAKDWCADCHSQRPRSHGADWRAAHGGRVAAHRGCEACHAGTFCIRCHGEVPKLNHDPALGLVK
jgi:cytochrome c nitrite reductase small subunit